MRQTEDETAFGLVVLLVSKAAGLNSEFPEVERDVSAGNYRGENNKGPMSRPSYNGAVIGFHVNLKTFSSQGYYTASERSPKSPK